MKPATLIQLVIATLLVVAACGLLTLARHKGPMARLSEHAWQVFVGCVFGALAIFGTEFGIPYDGAVISARDAAPLVAGLFFGGPAGILAGFIGGIERWFAVMWGAGEFTQLACCLGTIAAGFYAALLRKYLFDGKIPSWPMAFATGVIVEVLHLILVIMTNPEDVVQAFAIVKACTIPMVSAVAVATALSALLLARMSKRPVMMPKDKRGVAQIVQSRLLIGVVGVFVITIGFTAVLQTDLSKADTSKLLQLNISDVEQNVVNASDSNLLALTRKAATMFPSPETATNAACSELAATLDVAEIDVIGADGIIKASNHPAFVGFDMSSGEQSSEFMVLLSGDDQLVQSYQPTAYDPSVWRKYAGVAIDGGFVQVGYDSDNFTEDLSEQISASVRNRHIGQGGELAVIDESGNVSSSRVESDIDSSWLASDVLLNETGKVFETTFHGEKMYACYSEVEGYRIVAMLPASEADFSRDVAIITMSFVEVLVFAALFLVIYFTIKKVVVSSIWRVNGKLDQITKGNLDAKVDVRESSEFVSLSDDINKTVGVLKDSLDTVRADLKMAADIQAAALPRLSPKMAALPQFELFASMEPAKEIGGDFYDFFMIDDNHLALVVADVSGKGAPAALFMMRSKTTIQMEAMSGISPAEVLVHANHDLCDENGSGMFTTAWIGILELSSGKLVYADAGHEKMAVFHGDSWSLSDKPNRGVVLGVFGDEAYDALPDEFKFRNSEIFLAPGDALFQYTDGVPEANDSEGGAFGEERLLSTLAKAPSAHPAEVIAEMKSEIASFAGGAPQFDDITMLALLYNGTGGEKADGKESQC